MASTPPPEQPPTGGFAPPPPGPPPQDPPATAPLPWEQPGYPLLEGLYETIVLVLTKPSEAFSRMSSTGDLGRPLVYAVIFGWVGTLIEQVYGLAINATWRDLFKQLPGMENQLGFAFSTLGSIVAMIVAPVIVLFLVFFWSGILHLLLMLFGDGKQGYLVTVRVVCYAATTQIFQVVPVIGGPVAFIWARVLEIIGLRHSHKTDYGRTTAAVLLPVGLCCACIMLSIGIVVFGIAAAVAGGN